MNRPLTNDIIKVLALKKFNENEDNFNKTFKISNGWCTIFKKRWNVSTQKVKPSKIATNIPSEIEINELLDKYDELYSQTKKSLYLIMMKPVIT